MAELILGDVKITIPPEQKIDFTGQRALVKYDVPGDRPRYQDMGREERTVSFDGIFYGEGAYEKALTLQSYYDSGKNTDTGDSKAGFLLLFGEISCRVLIKSYSYQYYREDKIRYTLELVRLESDFDKKENKEVKTDKITKAKSGLEKLKDEIKKAMKIVNDVSKAAQRVNDCMFKARKDYLAVMKAFKTPIANLKKQISDVKWNFDSSLVIFNRSVGRASTPKNREELRQALSNVQRCIPIAQALILLAGQSSLGERLDEITGALALRPVKRGENLRTIANEIFGSPLKWTVLAQINRLPSSLIPADIKAIRVPDYSNIGTIEKLLDERLAQLPQAASDFIPVNSR